MRISTSQFYQTGINSILDQQAALNKTQIQMSTGKKVVTPSDDPAGAARIVQLQQSIDQTKAYQTNIDSANAALGNEENALSNGTNILQQVRGLALQANTGTLSALDRQSIAQQVQQDLQSIIGLANTTDGNGNYLFAGFSSNTRPFSQSAAGVSYAGDQGQRFLQIGPNRQVAISNSGYEVFQSIKSGNGTFTTAYADANVGAGSIDTGQVTDPTLWVPDTYTITFTAPDTYEVRDSAANLVTSGTYQSGDAIDFRGVRVTVSGAPAAGDSFTVAPSTNQDVFTTLQNLLDALNNPAGDPAAQSKFTTDINKALTNIDQVMDRFSSIRTDVGARMNTLDSQQSTNADFLTASQTALSAVQDLDYTQAASLLNQQLLGMQAAQQTFVRLQNLSLFNYLQ
jgi:flagellar hook-associated protein 3 FlgL